MLAAKFRLSDAKKINSADGTMNKPTTNIYFLFFGVQNHLILHGKLSRSEISVLRFFWFRRESDKSVMVKLHAKKNIEVVGSFNVIPITCR